MYKIPIPSDEDCQYPNLELITKDAQNKYNKKNQKLVNELLDYLDNQLYRPKSFLYQEMVSAAKRGKTCLYTDLQSCSNCCHAYTLLWDIARNKDAIEILNNKLKQKYPGKPQSTYQIYLELVDQEDLEYKIVIIW